MKRSWSEKAFNVFNIIFMLLMCAIMIYPYLNQLALSFNEGADSMFGGITFFPRKFTFANYISIFENSRFTSALVISVLRTVIGTLWGLTVTIGAAYAVTRKNLPGRRFISMFLMIPSYISAGVIPVYIVYRYTYMMNSFLVYIIPCAFAFYNMVVLRSFIQEIPESMEESAFLDGANELQILVKIIVPLSKPVIATVCLWLIVGQWNDWMTTLYYVTNKKLYPLQYLMMQLIKESEILQKMAQEASMTGAEINSQPTAESVKSASLIIATFPMIMIYPFFQKYFAKGVTLGAVKG